MNLITLICVFFPFITATITYFIGKKSDVIRNTLTIGSCFLVLAVMVYGFFSGTADEQTFSLLSMTFVFNGFQCIYGIITAFMWFCAALLSPKYFKGHHDLSRYYFFFLFTLGATMGVFLSGDLITTFIFFEIMSFTSYTWVVQDKTESALSAGKTYLTVAVIGGMVCLMGLFMLNNITGTLVINELYDVLKGIEKSTGLYVAAFCMLVGFGAKAGLFPLHIWLPKAHPVAPAPASALLSGVLTKTGIFGMLIITTRIMHEDEIWGYSLLLLGTITMVLGAILAVFSTNLKRTLACSSLSQIGFITVGIAMICLLGEHNALAANGTVLYMLNHSIVKLVLFLSAGVIYSGAHTLDINKLKGYGRNKPVLAIAFLTGGCSLAGIPGFCGYLSKTLVHESIVEYIPHGGFLIQLVEWLFLFSGGLTAAYVLKLFVTIFIQKPGKDTPKGEKLSPLSIVSLILSAVALPVIGILPHKLAEKISLTMVPFIFGHDFSHEVHYFSFVNLKGVLISLFIGIVVYALFIRKILMKTKDGQKIHYNPLAGKFSFEENIYKPVFRLIIKLIGSVCSALDKAPDIAIKAVLFSLTVVCRLLSDVTDFCILILSKTVFRFAKEPIEPVQHKYSYTLGNYLDKHSKDPAHSHRADTYVRISETLWQTTNRISKGFSFALLMTCLGVCLILLFLIFFKHFH
ncbi:MAG: NADH dehydrogenase [Clostridia bacterium]|nr:NADH dehydrogenase [Clostridia bacterium]